MSEGKRQRAGIRAVPYLMSSGSAYWLTECDLSDRRLFGQAWRVMEETVGVRGFGVSGREGRVPSFSPGSAVMSEFKALCEPKDSSCFLFLNFI